MPNNPVEFRSTGFIYGKYSPRDEWVGTGTFQTEDGTTSEAKLTSKMAHVFQRNPHLIEQSYLWAVWIKTDKIGNIKYTLKHFLTSPAIEEEKLHQLENLCDRFSIRGQLAGWNFKDNSFLIRIQRNERPKSDDEKNRWLYKPFAIKVYGKLLVDRLEKGQFWEIYCTRNGTNLVLESATLVKPSKKSKATQTKTLVKDGKPSLKTPPVIKKNSEKQLEQGQSKDYPSKSPSRAPKIKSKT
jgi:hypothetical protein